MSNDFQQWLDLDIEKIEEKPLNELQKNTIKNNILGNKKRNRAKKSWLVAAVAGVTILSTSYFTLPTIASQIPFIENIVSFVDPDFVPSHYEELSTVIGEVQSSNGIDLMIESAVFDGTNLIITYAVKTENDLGDNPNVKQRLDIKGSTGMGSVSSFEKIDETTYVGVEKIRPYFNGSSPEEVAIIWQPEAFINSSTESSFAGDWSFEFKISALPTNTQQVAATSTNDDAEFMITSVTYSDLTAVLKYEFNIAESVKKEWPFSTVDIVEVKDNFGNIHEIHGNGGIVSEDGHGFDWSATLYTLTEEVTTLTVTPEIYYSKGSGVQLEREEMEPIVIHLDK
nr:DUF4179 domain-containing protein [Lysinibacillus timonensis]